MIYTTYFAQLKKLPDNIIPISICGKVPGWYIGLQYKKLAPKYDFFMKWKETGDNKYYIDCFREQVLNKLYVYQVLGDLINKLPYIVNHSTPHITSPSSKFHIALVCYETPEKFCHRHLVSEWLKQNGIPCYEWRKDNNYEGL